MKLHWPELHFPPVNLWSAPVRYLVEYKEFTKGKRKTYSTRIISNPLYDLRSNG